MVEARAEAEAVGARAGASEAILSGAGLERSEAGAVTGAGASSTSSVFDAMILVKSTVISVSYNLRPST